MIGAYLATAIAISVSEVLFLENFLASLGLKAFMPNAYAAACGFIAVAGIAAYRDVRLSARFGLVLEVASILILVAITAVVVFQRGTVVDARQLDFTSLGYGGIMTSLTFAVFSFVGFRELGDAGAGDAQPGAQRAAGGHAQRPVVGSVLRRHHLLHGARHRRRHPRLGDSSAPFIVMTERAGLSAAGTAMYFGALISGLACLLASINAGSRLMFSMARYGYLAAALTTVHRRHRTPSAAVLLTVAVTLVGSLATLPLGALEAFGFAGRSRPSAFSSSIS
jgi:Amino acid transporters